MDTKLKDLIINEVTEEKLKELEDNNEIPPNELFVTEDEDEALIVDEVLNANSENPIANKAVTQKFNEIEPSVLFAESERQKSKNLFDINAKRVVQGGHSFVNGNTITVEAGGSSETDAVFGLIPVKENTTYYIGANASKKRLLFRIYDENKNVITSAIPNWTYNQYWQGSYHDFETTDIITQLTIPQGAKYLALQTAWLGSEQTFSDVIISEYPDVEHYQSYNGPITHDNDAPVIFAESERQKTKNLLPVMSTAEVITIGENGLITFNGNVGAWIYDIFIGEIYLKKGKTYTLSIQNYSGSGKQLFTFQAKKVSDGTAIRDYLYTYDTEGRVTPTEDVILTSGGFYFASQMTVNFSCFIQIEEGSIVTEYQPYNGAIVHNKDIIDKTMCLINEVYLTNEEFSSISFENLHCKDGDVFKLIVTGSTNVAADGHILFNDIDSGMQSLEVSAYAEEGATDSSVVGHSTSICPFRVDTGSFYGQLTFGVNKVYNGSFIWYDLVTAQVHRSSKPNYFRHITGSLLDQDTLNRLTIYFGASAYRGTRLKLYKLGGKLVG